MDHLETILTTLPPPLSTLLHSLLVFSLSLKDSPLFQHVLDLLVTPFTTFPPDPVKILTTLGIIYLSFCIMGMATRWVMSLVRMVFFLLVLVVVLVAVVGGKDAVDALVGVAKEWLVGHQSQFMEAL